MTLCCPGIDWQPVEGVPLNRIDRVDNGRLDIELSYIQSAYPSIHPTPVSELKCPNKGFFYAHFHILVSYEIQNQK